MKENGGGEAWGEVGARRVSFAVNVHSSERKSAWGSSEAGDRFSIQEDEAGGSGGRSRTFTLAGSFSPETSQDEETFEVGLKWEVGRM